MIDGPLTRLATLLAVVAVVGGCSDEKPPPSPSQRVVKWTTSPELIEFFGGAENLDDVRNNSPSSWLEVLPNHSNPPQPPRAWHNTDYLSRFAELLAMSDSYDWTKPTDGEFVPDIQLQFTGPSYWKAENENRSGVSVVVRLDLNSEILEVTSTTAHGRACFSPVAERLRVLLTRAGIELPGPRRSLEAR